tara:strand:- start:73 stop:870 length:798 start_codon:yes stop_codon:yes gene_type:complete
MAGFWDGLPAALIGGGLSYLGATQQQKAIQEAAQTQAATIGQASDAAITQATPYGVGSIGGTASFDPDTKSALLNLSPELQNIYQGALSRSGLFGEQVLPYAGDPFAAADMFYQQQQPYFQRDEDRLRQDLETRQLAQGRLGSTGGAQERGSVEEAILRSQNERRSQSFGQAQTLIDSLLGRETGDISTATGLLNIPMQQANLGRGLGGDIGRMAAAGLDARSAAASNLGNVTAARSSGTANAFGALGGLFTDRYKYAGLQKGIG